MLKMGLIILISVMTHEHEFCGSEYVLTSSAQIVFNCCGYQETNEKYCKDEDDDVIEKACLVQQKTDFTSCCVM